MDIFNIVLAAILATYPINFLLLVIITRVFGHRLHWQVILGILLLSEITVWFVAIFVFCEIYHKLYTFILNIVKELEPLIYNGVKGLIESIFDGK